ncbi:MAG: efflux RND transporter permease subunit, partial [Candidatus Lindowbacteria bacterium]|nr:efflux RND transporter permease subunit [Candidatus Lindowbacteria bacterium]
MADRSGPLKHGFIEKVIEYCARNRLFIFIITVTLFSGSLWTMKNVPLDAIPDLSDTQVIIFVQWDGRDPQLVEDQVTYPLITSLLAAPNVKVVRGFSDFSMAYIYIIFEDGTDIYWARARVLEYLSKIQGSLPKDAKVQLGPDATGLGWVYQYALVDKTGKNSLADLRTYQDWTLRYALEGVSGVAEVASIGGFVQSYQIEIDPNALAEYGISINDAVSRVRKSNRDVGGRVVEMAGREYIVRGLGYIKSKEEIANIGIGLGAGGTPVRIRDVGRVTLGPDLRRGVAELDGEGEVVGGVVIIRYGENALNVIEKVKTRIEEVRPTLPKGVELVSVYDRSDLILNSIDTLKHTLTEEMIVVAVIIILFLWHLPSAIVPIITIPVAVCLSFIPMWYYGVTSNIMSLGGIAVAIGALVDASIVVVENIHKKLEEWIDNGSMGRKHDVILRAIQEVGRPSFFSLLIIAVSFLPVFALTGQEGRLFRPLAITKTLSMGIAGVLAVTLVPAICLFVFREKDFSFRPKWLARIFNAVLGTKIQREEDHPISRMLHKIYEPVCRFILEWPKAIVSAAIALVLVTAPIYFQLGSEFMPTLWEGTFLYMPSTAYPSASVESASRALQVQDKLIAEHPAVERVFGKVGRAVTATDPAPLTMVETTITLKDESEWPRIKVDRWYSSWLPERLKGPFQSLWPEEQPISWRQVKTELDQKLQIPGWPNICTMPIENRVNMLTTGIRALVGVKVFGSDLETIDDLSNQIAIVLRNVPGAASIITEPILGAPYLDIKIDRDEIARYNLTIEDVNAVIESAIGGVTISTTVEGRERYPIQMRYPRELRGDPNRIRRVLVPIPFGSTI